MEQTSAKDSEEWVFIVRHSETLHFQILDETQPRVRRPKWVRVLVRVFKIGTKLYGLR